MNPLFLWRMTIKRQAGLLRLRQYCRQITKLLGFGAVERVSLGATVFALAWPILERRRRVLVVFQLRGQFLEIQVTAPGHPPDCRQANLASQPTQANLATQANQEAVGSWRLTKKLPAQNLSAEDVAWIVRQSLGREKEPLFAEMVRQNQELLEMVEELRGREQVPVRLARTTAA